MRLVLGSEKRISESDCIISRQCTCLQSTRCESSTNFAISKSPESYRSPFCWWLPHKGFQNTVQKLTGEIGEVKHAGLVNICKHKLAHRKVMLDLNISKMHETESRSVKGGYNKTRKLK